MNSQLGLSPTTWTVENKDKLEIIGCAIGIIMFTQLRARSAMASCPATFNLDIRLYLTNWLPVVHRDTLE